MSKVMGVRTEKVSQGKSAAWLRLRGAVGSLKYMKGKWGK